jgi:pimeloyl-[acyl-carrier protein] methyl ester esterase
MSRPTLLLVHGWGLGPGIWRPLLEQMDNPPHYCLDFGFFGQEKTAIPSDQPLIAVGHSLGFLWLLQHLDNAPWAEQVQGLVSINGFSRFAKADDFPHGVEQCLIRRMKNGLQRDPVKVLNSFRELGGGPAGDFISADAKKRMDTTALAYGLAWLLEWDGRPGLGQWNRPLMAIANQDDNIVTPTMTEASFSAPLAEQSRQIEWLSGGGHMGLMMRYKSYAVLLEKFYKAFL